MTYEALSALCRPAVLVATFVLTMTGSSLGADVGPASQSNPLASETRPDVLHHLDKFESNLAGAPTSGRETTGAGHLQQDHAIHADEDAIVENGWDFTKPDSIPGFASTPYPLTVKPEAAQ